MSNGGSHDRPNLHKILASVALVAVLVLGVLAGAVGLSRHAVSQANQVQANLRVHSAQVAIKAAEPLCKALVDMDKASVGAVFSNGKWLTHRFIDGTPGANLYSYRLSKAVHELVKSTKCDILLRDVQQHKSFAQIEKDTR